MSPRKHRFLTGLDGFLVAVGILNLVLSAVSLAHETDRLHWFLVGLWVFISLSFGWTFWQNWRERTS